MSEQFQTTELDVAMSFLELIIIEPRLLINKLVVFATCGDLPISVGDVFWRLFSYRLMRFEEYKPRQLEILSSQHVSLTVKSIECYGNSYETLPPGMAGTILLDGTGGELVKAKMVLSNEQT